MKNILLNSLRLGIVTRPLDEARRSISGGRYEELGAELTTLVRRNFGRSFHIREVDAGSCNACESEIITATNPLYDIQRFGIDFVASPRHADALLVTGPVSKNMALALRRTYEAVPKPKIVIACGDCASCGGPFKGSYYTFAGVHEVIPVDVRIPGCPPRPEALIGALVDLLKKP